MGPVRTLQYVTYNDYSNVKLALKQGIYLCLKQIKNISKKLYMPLNLILVIYKNSLRFIAFQSIPFHYVIEKTFFHFYLSF